MTQPKADIAAMFDEVWSDDEFRFDIKAREVATNLARALHEAGMNRTQLSEKLGWRPSRVSKVLGGEANLTLKTLYQVCDAVDLEFDVVLRAPNQAPAAQPWEVRHIESDIRRLHTEAQHMNAYSKAMLQNVRQINRSTWQRTVHVNQVIRTGHARAGVVVSHGVH